MKANNLIIENLQQIMLNKELIYISGITSFGEKFDVAGYIAVANDGTSGICVTDSGDLGLMMQLGGTPNQSIVGTSVGMAPFLTVLEKPSKDMPKFYILHIRDSKHKMLLANPESENILNYCKTNGNKRWGKKYNQGIQLAEDDIDPVTKVIKERIGQKIILDGRAMIAAAVDGLDNNGCTIVWGYDNVYLITAAVKKGSRLQVENIDGEIVQQERNDPSNLDIKRKFSSRETQVLAANVEQRG